jgi:hypothetical protein
MQVAPRQTFGTAPDDAWRYISKYPALSHAWTVMLFPFAPQMILLHPVFSSFVMVLVHVSVAASAVVQEALLGCVEVLVGEVVFCGEVVLLVQAYVVLFA